MSSDFSNLERPSHPMPEFVRIALEERRLMKDYRERPAYQQNDYLGWINRAKQQETQEKRLRQMLEELEAGGIYMKMDHPPSKRTKKTVNPAPVPDSPFFISVW
ncbi:MAG: YdeI/OmpD-associated family protein [Balneolaceae bacterium]